MRKMRVIARNLTKKIINETRLEKKLHQPQLPASLRFEPTEQKILKRLTIHDKNAKQKSGPYAGDIVTLNVI
jgi:hypothetical protein